MDLKYIYANDTTYCLHGENPLNVADAGRYQVVTLRDIATCPKVGRTTRLMQAIGQKAWGGGPFDTTESIRFTRSYLSELRRGAGDLDYAIFMTMPESYQFTVYAIIGAIADIK